MGVFHDTMRSGSRFDGQVRRRKFFATDSRASWSGQHTNPVRAERRAAIKAAGGIRQFKKARHD